MKKYFPILLSKSGELTALSKLNQNVKDELSPILQVLSGNIEHIKKFASSWDFTDNELFLDFSVYEDDFSLVSHFISDLISININVIPVVQLNSSKEYIDILRVLFLNGGVVKLGIRFSNASGGFIDFNNKITGMLSSLNISEKQASIILDFGLIDRHNYNTNAALGASLINNLPQSSDYDNIIIASGSFLENLSSLSPAGRVYRIQRYEWDMWNSIINVQGLPKNIKYSDYGTKYPYYSEANFLGSCSIKYTVESEYVIFRGEISTNHKDGNGQYITFSEKLVKSDDYLGEHFSWADEKINFYAEQNLKDPKKKTGNATSWVEISQNHHLTLLHSIL